MEDGNQYSSNEEGMTEDLEDEDEYEDEEDEGDEDLTEEEGEITPESQENRQRSDDTLPSLFPADPISRRGSSLVETIPIPPSAEAEPPPPSQQPRSEPTIHRSLPPISPMGTLPTPRPGLISLFNPNPFGNPKLGTSAGTGSSGSQTPKALLKNLPSMTRSGSYGFPRRTVSSGDGDGVTALPEEEDEEIDPKTLGPIEHEITGQLMKKDTEATPLLSRKTPSKPVVIQGSVSETPIPSQANVRKLSLSPSTEMSRRSSRISTRRYSEVRRRFSANITLRRKKSEFELGSSTDGQTVSEA